MKTPRVLGVDDWAKRKGQSYGTILVDLENRRTIDLLPERSAASLSTWLKAHTGVEVISRDRGTEYIKGVTDGALAAIQVADRWHLLSNLKDTLKRMLEGKRVCLKAVAESAMTKPEDSSHCIQEEVNFITNRCDNVDNNHMALVEPSDKLNWPNSGDSIEKEQESDMATKEQTDIPKQLTKDVNVNLKMYDYGAGKIR